ncbi:MAG: class I SAM-dependent methyltransferase [Ignavibacteriae bacterium]|nr:class I SAM-dependent methyltransferase [Ignavibacteria bacterium]MBI3364612.1 class I SAM-dependent methyltransferase [Ignavibacteriota bacterium]
MPPVTAQSSGSVSIEPGSFRDRNGRIYYYEGAIYRGLSLQALENYSILAASQFYKNTLEAGTLIETRQVGQGETPETLQAEGWAAVLKHARVPFISYPYEWSFGMLKDAALLQLDLLNRALNEDLTMKDATSYNIQWFGSKPVFIDIPSFEKFIPGTPWVGYRQFCELFLYPLMLQAYKDVEFHQLLRGRLDGITPEECKNLMSFRDKFRPGVFMDVVLQAKLQKKYSQTTNNVRANLRATGFRKEMITSNIARLTKIIRRFEWKRSQSVWSDYATNTSYTDADTKRKEEFVRSVVAKKHRNLVWDLGCNTGAYSRIAAKNSEYVVATDFDHLAIERLYHELKKEGNATILPLVMNLADASPNLGWRGLERKALTERAKPDLVLCLALIHHIVISANVPLKEFIDWMASLGGDLVIEFVTKDDPMTKILLANKDDQYDDYSLDFLEQCLADRFHVRRREQLASGTRIMYFAQTLS